MSSGRVVAKTEASVSPNCAATFSISSSSQATSPFMRRWTFV